MNFKNFLKRRLFENSVNLHGDTVKVKGKEVGCLKKCENGYKFTKTDNTSQEFESLNDFYEYIINNYKIKIGSV